MKKTLFLLLLSLVFACQKTTEKVSEPKLVINTQIEALFTENNLEGTFVLYDPKSDTLITANEERAKTEFLPASTFKIPNSLIALTTSVIVDEDAVFYIYDGSPVFLPEWAKDMNLRDAIKTSNVPAYQQLANLIGLERMQENIGKLNYGNQEIGEVVDVFWLEGPLKISAIGQIEFLQKLATKTLPYPIEAQNTVEEIMEIDRAHDWVLYGKTGFGTSNPEPNPQVGWFVGWLKKGQDVYPFALNINIKSDADLPKRIEITRMCLNQLGLL